MDLLKIQTMKFSLNHYYGNEKVKKRMDLEPPMRELYRTLQHQALPIQSL